MTTAKSELGQVLASVFELPAMAITAEALAEWDETLVQDAIAGGFIVDDGFEPMIRIDDDPGAAPTALKWVEEKGGYCYFSEHSGWIEVDDAAVRRYRLETMTVLARISQELKTSTRHAPKPVIDDIVWDLGEFRLPGRSHAVSIWFARRLSVPAVWQKLKELSRSRPARNQRILLTSTGGGWVPSETLACVTVIRLEDVDSGSTGFSIKPQFLRDYLDRSPRKAADGLPELISDGREVRFLGQTFLFPKGDVQRRIIRLLRDRAVLGERSVSSAFIMAELDLAGARRVRDVFKGSPAWGKLLTEQGGVCRFCWEEDDPTD